MDVWWHWWYNISGKKSKITTISKQPFDWVKLHFSRIYKSYLILFALPQWKMTVNFSKDNSQPKRIQSRDLFILFPFNSSMPVNRWLQTYPPGHTVFYTHPITHTSQTPHPHFAYSVRTVCSNCYSFILSHFLYQRQHSLSLPWAYIFIYLFIYLLNLKPELC